MPSDDSHYVPVRLARVVLRNASDQQWIFLEEVGGKRGFPIVIGSAEAHEIHRVLHDESPPRPLTHQLAHAAIEALGSRVVGVDIVDLRNNTFFARLLLRPLEEGGEPVKVDARPSDALAIGLRAGAQLRVAESVLEQVRTDTAQDVLPPSEAEAEGASGDVGNDDDDSDSDNDEDEDEDEDDLGEAQDVDDED